MDAISELRKRLDKAGTQTALAKELGISKPYLSDILRGRRDPGPKVLEQIGIRRIVMFEPIGDVADRVVKGLDPND